MYHRHEDSMLSISDTGGVAQLLFPASTEPIILVPKMLKGVKKVSSRRHQREENPHD